MKERTDKDKTLMPAREVAVLMEELKSQFRVFGDELKTITGKTEAIETTVGKTWEKVTGIDLRLIRVENKLNNVDKRLSAVETLK